MTKRALGLALSFTVLGPLAFAADLAKYKDFAKSPEFVLLATDAEQKAWKSVKTDAAAEDFIALFWAKRDPDLKTPANEFKRDFDARVKAADDHFKMASKRGALTERGRLFILVGPPKSVSVTPGTKPFEPSIKAGVESVVNEPGTSIGENITAFVYDAGTLPAAAGIKTLVARFAVEQTQDSLIGPPDVRRMETAAIAAAIKNPTLEKAPFPAGAGETFGATTAAKPGAPPPPPISEAVMTALGDAIAKPAFGALTALPLGYRDGGTRLMIQVYVSREPARVAWLVRGKDGDLSRGEEPARAEKAGNGFVVDRAIPLPPGDYDVAVVLYDEAGAPVHTAKRSVTAAAPASTLSASPLYVGVLDQPPPAAADAPFVFSGRKFVSRGDGKVTTKDGLSYVVRVYGPGIDPETKKAFLKRKIRIQPKGGSAMEVPTPVDEPIAVSAAPEGGTTVLDIAGIVVDANVGDYFKPGEYTFKVSVEDAVAKTKVEVSEPFTIVK